MRHLLLHVLTGVICVGSSLAVQAAETTQAVSVFAKPTYASKQITILPAGAQVQVTGAAKNEDEQNWIPIQTPDGTGWVVAGQIDLKQGDPGYVNWPGKNETMWLWVSFGPSAISSDDFYIGKRIAFGVDWFVNDQRRFFIGPAVSTERSNEKLTAQYSGEPMRYNTYFSFGYLLLPDRLYTRFGLGLSILAGANRNFGQKFGASGLAEFGYHFPLSDGTKLGMSFSFEYTGKSRQSVNFLQDLYHCVAGGCDTSYATPSATIFALNAVLSLAP